MPSLWKPRPLPSGGTVGIAAPAGPVDPERLAAGEKLWRDAGYRVVRRGDLLARQGYLAGDDARRAKELMDLISDPEVDAIVCARGGYGCHRIVSLLEASRVRAARKPLVGYSDVTTLLLWQRRQAGLAGFHGPMLERGEALERESLAALIASLEGRRSAAPLCGRGAGGGRAQGRFVGGSLTTLVASLGTPWEVDLRGAIFLFEEVAEAPYRIDRMLQQLRAAGKLAKLAGVGVGQLVDCVSPRYAAPTAEEVIAEIVRPLGLPLVFDLPFGHVTRNLTWPFGLRAEIDGEQGTVRALERGVAGDP